MVNKDDFPRILTNPPDVSMAALQWDENLIGKELLMYWNKTGYQCWYHGLISAYDSSSMRHSIEWLEDDDPDSVVDLLACRMCFEWRLVQDDEDAQIQLARLRG